MIPFMSLISLMVIWGEKDWDLNFFCKFYTRVRKDELIMSIERERREGYRRRRMKGKVKESER